jgi:IS30 family transposase
MPFEWVVGDSSKDHAVTASTSCDVLATVRYTTLWGTTREEIALLRVQGKGVREIARAIGRDPGTISRELRRNAATRSTNPGYRASVAQWKADMAARRPKVAKLVANPRLREYVQDRLSPDSPMQIRGW